MSNYQQRLQSYNSYSGCDMVATVKISSHTGLKDTVYTLGSLQTISISTHQDKRPVRSVGNINAKEYTMGQRTIAGSLVFAVFDQHFADQMFKDSLSAINSSEQNKISTVMLADELPPFDITISYANEYGHTSRMALYGVRLVDEGQVMSINDIYTENTYQFYATALEPLNKDSGGGQTYKGDNRNKIYDKPRHKFNAPANLNMVLTSFNNNNYVAKKEKVTLNVTVENPNSINDKGLAKFTIDPQQKNGEIFIYGTDRNPITINLLDYPNTSIYHAYLKAGSYYAFYESHNKLSNTVHFKVNREVSSINEYNTSPIIDYVTDSSVSIISNDPSHDTVACKKIKNKNFKSLQLLASEDEDEIITVNLKAKRGTFKGLTPNTLYEIYTYSDSEKVNSNTTTVKTLKYSTELIDNFKTFISLNNKILINSEDALFKLIEQSVEKTKDYSNVVDFVLSIRNDSNNNYKEELLFLAIKFQNCINYDLNKYSSIKQPKKNIINPFYNTIYLPDNANYSNFFKVERGKSIFEEKVENTSSYEFLGRNNLRYYGYGAIDKCIGPRYDFICFSIDEKNKLTDYSDTNLLASLSKDPISEKFKSISSININRLAAEYYKKPHVEYLPKPKIKVNNDLSVSINLNYNDTLSETTDIIIAFCETEEALDTTPLKKIKTKYYDELIVSSSHTGIKFNSSYLVWIENMDGLIISSIESFNTYIEDQVLMVEDENIKTKIVSDILDDIRNKLETKTTINSEINNIFESQKSLEECHEADVYDNLISNIITNKDAFSNVFGLIANMFKVKSDSSPFITDAFKVNVIYDLNNKKLMFDSDSYFAISATHIDEFNGEIDKDVITNIDNTYTLINSSGYTLLSCLSTNSFNTTGFVLIDNKNGKYITHKMEVEVIQ